MLTWVSMCVFVLVWVYVSVGEWLCFCVCVSVLELLCAVGGVCVCVSLVPVCVRVYLCVSTGVRLLMYVSMRSCLRVLVVIATPPHLLV